MELFLSLVEEAQGPGEPLHWSPFVAHENEPWYIYQVKGDAEHMVYELSHGNLNIPELENLYNIYQLAALTEDQPTMVRHVAE